jgi:hypothetical protein
MRMTTADGREIEMIATKIDRTPRSMSFFSVPPGFIEANTLLPSP